jgi:hypothetical protein
MDEKALKENIITIFKNNANILTTDYEPLTDLVIEPMQKEFVKEKEKWQKERKELLERIKELEKKSVVPTLPRE